MLSIEDRLARLEAESEIRRLKARYFNACDAKDVEAIRACFTPDAVTDYRPLGEFDPESLIAVFTTIAVASGIVDVHQGHNAEIEILEPDHASGRWNLGFATFDPAASTYRLMSGVYDDRYIRTPQGWRIAYSRHQPRSIVEGVLAADGLTGSLTLP